MTCRSGLGHASPDAQRPAVAVAGTPFYFVFKVAACAGSLVVAAPASALFALGGSGPGSEAIDILGDGLQQNCGPPYVLAP